jgi:hypothetical protein
LSYPPHTSLNYSDIDFNTLTDVEKMFIPIFEEMKEIKVDLSLEEFIQAGIRLLKYLSPS